MNKEQLIDLLLKLYPQDVLNEPLNYENTNNKRKWVWDVFNKQFTTMFDDIVDISTINENLNSLNGLISSFKKAQDYLKNTHQHQIQASHDTYQDLQNKIDNIKDIIKTVKTFAHKNLQFHNQLYYTNSDNLLNISSYHVLTKSFVKNVVNCAIFQWKHRSLKINDDNTLEFEPLFVVRKYMKKFKK